MSGVSAFANWSLSQLEILTGSGGLAGCLGSPGAHRWGLGLSAVSGALMKRNCSGQFTEEVLELIFDDSNISELTVSTIWKYF